MALKMSRRGIFGENLPEKACDSLSKGRQHVVATIPNPEMAVLVINSSDSGL
jgi:hypothetical protein